MERKRKISPASETVKKLLYALRRTDPAWRLVLTDRLSSGYALEEGSRVFCRGIDLDALLSDFEEACRDENYVCANGFGIPGMLLHTAGGDDLRLRLEVLA